MKINLWKTWLILTVFYVVFSYAIGNEGGFTGSSVGLIGLFVPFGPITLLYFGMNLFLGVEGFIYVITFLIGVFAFVLITHFLNQWLKDNNFSTIKIVLISLLYLFVFTIALDFALWQEWTSLKVFMQEGRLIEF